MQEQRSGVPSGSIARSRNVATEQAGRAIIRESSS